MRKHTKDVIKQLGYKESDFQGRKADIVEWVLCDATDEQAEELLQFMKDLQGGKQ